jgi:hypothetical protein
MPPLKEINDELDFVTDRISTQVRTIALSVLALVWLFLAGGKDAPALPTAPARPMLLGIAAVTIAALVADYLQYLFGYLATNAVRIRAEAAREKAADFDYSDYRYRLRVWFFWGKQFLTLVAVAGIGVAIANALLA